MMTLEFILRIFVAAVLGGLIGLEREYREKAAGLRTHFLVALGSALFMIISAHGFDGILKDPNMRLDVSRIAAQVVVGHWFYWCRDDNLSEKCCAWTDHGTGVWVTAAIGLGCGAGLYVLSAVATVLVLMGMEAFNYVLRHLEHHHAKNEDKALADETPQNNKQ